MSRARADDGTRTHDTWLGKPVLYQLSYVREACMVAVFSHFPCSAHAPHVPQNGVIRLDIEAYRAVRQYSHRCIAEPRTVSRPAEPDISTCSPSRRIIRRLNLGHAEEDFASQRRLQTLEQRAVGRVE